MLGRRLFTPSGGASCIRKLEALVESLPPYVFPNLLRHIPETELPV